MEQEIIKPIIRVGNSAGVLLPREWLNGKARIRLVEKPMDLKADILGILKGSLDKIIGIYIVGSYARGEQKEDSDVDVLAVTENTNSKLKKGKYNIMMISLAELEKQIENSALPIIPMLREARPIINREFLSRYKNAKLTRKNLRFHIETTKSALKVIKKALDFGNEKVSDNIAYSLVLRLREVYIVKCLRKGKIPTSREFLGIVKKISGSEEAYCGYIRAKEKPSGLEKLSSESARKIYEYVRHKIIEQEKWTGKGKSSWKKEKRG